MLANWMTENPRVVTPDTTVAVARERLNGFRHLAVSNRGLVGYLHAADLDAAPSGAQVADLGFHSAMTVPDCVSLDSALQRLRSSRHDALWVLDEADALVGVFTEHDAARVAAERLDPTLLVDAIATAAPEVVHASATVREARERMARLWVRHLPVTTDTGRLAGVLSWRDLEGVDDATPLVDQIRREPFTTTWGTPVRDVARLMVEHTIGAVPVLDEDATVAGITTRIDLIRALLAPVEVS